MNWSRIIGNMGRTLIASGVLILLFVVYQLWGTALQERRAQNQLRGEFQELLEIAAPEAAPILELDNSELPARIEPEAIVAAASSDEPVASSGAVLVDPSALILDPEATVFGPPPPPPEGGDAIAQLRIPAIGVDKVVVEGVGTNALKDGPGHYPGTPLPGQPGNAAIAGHRTTYGAPFYDLDGLEENDLIYVTTAQGSFQYRVTESFVVSPSDVWVLDNTDDDRLTLTTCHPRFSARERLVVVAALIGPAASIDPSTGSEAAPVELPGEPVSGEGAAESDSPAPADGVVTEEGNDGAVPITAVPIEPEVADAPVDGLVSHIDGDRAAAWPAIFWGLLAAFVWTVTWYVGQQWRRWPSYIVGGLVFLVVLFVFFENFSRLLPPGV